MPRVTLNQSNNNMIYFRGWVRAMMDTRGMKAEDLALYLNITPQSLRRKLKGTEAWSLQQAFKIYELFGQQYVWR